MASYLSLPFINLAPSTLLSFWMLWTMCVHPLLPGRFIHLHCQPWQNYQVPVFNLGNFRFMTESGGHNRKAKGEMRWTFVWRRAISSQVTLIVVFQLFFLTFRRPSHLLHSIPVPQTELFSRKSKIRNTERGGRRIGEEVLQDERCRQWEAPTSWRV